VTPPSKNALLGAGSPEVGEIEMSSSSWKSSGSFGAGAVACVGSKSVDATENDDESEYEGAGERGAAEGVPPSANIGLFGSSWRPSATAFCQTSPWPWLTA